MPMHGVVEAVWQALLLAVRLSAPALLVCFLAGLAASLLQRALQLQDGVLTWAPKWVALLLCLALSAAAMGRELLRFTLGLWQRLPA